MNPIITSILDNDLYKLTMQQLVLHQYPNDSATYRFKCRNENVKLGFLSDKILKEIKKMEGISLQTSEKKFLQKSAPFLTRDYLKYLSTYKFNSKQVNISESKGDLELEITGPWVETILWEVPILAIINELYFRETSDFKTIEGEGIRRLKDKINLIRQYPTLTIADFGTRRRYSGEWQCKVLKDLLLNCPQIIGTSNVKMAQAFRIKPIGTMAHEFFSAHLALVDNIRTAQKRALHVWLQEYGQNLGIALTDTFTSSAFFRDFGTVLAQEFSGLRQDSGVPFVFGENAIAHYKKMGIDPKTKTLIFSDSLDVPKAINIYKNFIGRIGVSFGIGTNLTNDLGKTPLNIVIKLIKLNDTHVVKLSDDEGKAMGKSNMIKKVKKSYLVI